MMNQDFLYIWRILCLSRSILSLSHSILCSSHSILSLNRSISQCRMKERLDSDSREGRIKTEQVDPLEGSLLQIPVQFPLHSWELKEKKCQICQGIHKVLVDRRGRLEHQPWDGDGGGGGGVVHVTVEGRGWSPRTAAA